MINQENPELAGHLIRVGNVCCKIGRWLGLDHFERDLLSRAGKLHDCGKSKISQEILKKAGPLSQEERREIEFHPRLGFLLVCFVDKTLARIIAAHHEQANRPHYPRRGQRRRGLIDLSPILDERTGQERREMDERIKRLAELLSIADIYDALSQPRPYKDAWSREQVRGELLRNFPHQEELIDRLIKEEMVQS